MQSRTRSTLGFAAHAIAVVIPAFALCSTLLVSTAEAARRAGDDPRLGGFLNELVATHAREGDAGARALATARGLQTRVERGVLQVAVILEPRPGLDARRLSPSGIEARGGRLDAASRSRARVYVSPARLRELASHPDVGRLRPPTPATPLDGLGPQVSESVALTGASNYQAHGFKGAGIKIAIVDLGFIGLTNAIAQGELSPATVRVNLPGTQDDDLETGSDHGTAVAEHAADMAPEAMIHCIKVGDEVDLENAADYAASNGVRVINHSVGWVNSSYYDDTGPINGLVNESHDVDQVFWTVAAGNFKNLHFRRPWVDANANGDAEFSGADERMDITSGVGTARVFLNWNQYGNSVTDLDLYVYDKNGIVVASSEVDQNGPQEPSEAVNFFYSGAGVPYRIQVRRFAGPTTGLDFTLFSFNNQFEYAVPASSLADPANAHGAFVVAAIDQANWTLSNPPAEPFSSQGPTTDGRQKPDITAPDGTSSFTYGVHGGYGTSFSSPTTAGAAAILLGQDASLEPAELGAMLQERARDVGDPGPDPVYGAGQLALPTVVPLASPSLLAALGAVLAAAGAWVVRRSGSQTP